MKKKMKKCVNTFALASLLLFILACVKDDDNELSGVLPGQEQSSGQEDSSETLETRGFYGLWTLTEANLSFGGVRKYDAGKIIYDFKEDGKLIVNDPNNPDVFLSDGEHKMTLSNNIISIDNKDYYLIIVDSHTIRIDTGSAYDGPVYTFVMK